MDFDETELEVADILLRYPLLHYDYEIRRMFRFSWGSKKKRSMRRRRRFITPLSRRKNPLSSWKSKILKITLKSKTSENNHHHQNSSNLCAVKDESSSKRKKVIQSSESAGRFLFPDRNLPLLIKEEKEHYRGDCRSKKRIISPRSVSARDHEDARNGCCTVQPKKSNCWSRIQFR